jgi:hypothetical protein
VNISSTQFGSGARSSYNSLQASVNAQLGEELQLISSLTWSHAIDNTSDFAATGGAFSLPQDSLSPSERGSSNFDVRLRSVTELLVDSSSFARRPIFRKWQLSGIVTLQTGQPYTINTSFDVNMDGNTTDRLNNTNPQYLTPASGSRTQWTLNAPESMLLADPGQEGSVGRNTFRGWGLYNVDLAFGRTFSTCWNHSLRLRTEVFNLVNHPDFGIPDRILESPAFGRAVTTVVPPRIIQIALKYMF